MQDAGRAPLRLGDGDAGAAGHGHRLAEGPVRVEVGNPQPGGVPWHLRQVPLQPREAAPVRRGARRRDEVRPRDDDPARVPITGVAIAGGAVREPDRDQDVAHGLCAIVGGVMVLADRVQDLANRVRAQVRVPRRAGRREGLGRRDPVGVEHPQPSIRERRRDDPAAIHDVAAAAVLMDGVADVERCRRDLAGHPVRRVAQQRPPSALDRAALQPVDVVAVDRGLCERDR